MSSSRQETSRRLVVDQIKRHTVKILFRSVFGFRHLCSQFPQNWATQGHVCKWTVPLHSGIDNDNAKLRARFNVKQIQCYREQSGFESFRMCRSNQQGAGKLSNRKADKPKTKAGLSLLHQPWAINHPKQVSTRHIWFQVPLDGSTTKPSVPIGRWARVSDIFSGKMTKTYLEATDEQVEGVCE